VINDPSPNDAYDLILSNLDNRYEKKPVHSLEELQDLKDKYPNRLHFWKAQDKEGNVLGTVVSFMVNKQGAHDFYIAKNFNFAKHNVMPFLFTEIFKHYQSEGYNWFNFGISSRGDFVKWGILQAKEKLGGRASVREHWTIEDLKPIEQENE
jgi:lipid II:glycine glycyltransferase (peptidoglycan interpeptide bridge formation enzyme)